MIETRQRVGTEGTYVNIIKAVYDKPTANIILNVEKLKAFPVRSGTRHGCPLCHLHSTQYQIFSESCKETEGIQIGKEVKLSLF